MSEIKKAKILVTGGTGYIGAHTVVELQQSGYEVVIIDNLSNSNIKILDQIKAITGVAPTFKKIDMRDKADEYEFIQAHHELKGIIHFSASKSVGESVKDPLHY